MECEQDGRFQKVKNSSWRLPPIVCGSRAKTAVIGAYGSACDSSAVELGGSAMSMAGSSTCWTSSTKPAMLLLPPSQCYKTLGRHLRQPALQLASRIVEGCVHARVVL